MSRGTGINYRYDYEEILRPVFNLYFGTLYNSEWFNKLFTANTCFLIRV